MKLSIITPIYNTSEYLTQCLKSLRNQNMGEVEFICINDGSTDNSLEILKEYAVLDSRFVIIDKENEGFGRTLNLGLEVAKGEYIGFLESDDYAEPDAYKRLYERAVGLADSLLIPDIVKGNYRRLSSNNIKAVLPYEKFNYSVPFEPIDIPEIFKVDICYWTGIYRRDFLINNNIRFHETPGASYQDTSFYYLALMCAESMVLIPDEIVNYRTDNEASSVNDKRKVYCIKDEFKYLETEMIKRRFGDRYWYLEAELKFMAYCFNFERVMDYYKYPFLECFRAEFQKLYDDGMIKEKLWGAGNYKNLMLLLNNPEEFYESSLPAIRYTITDKYHDRLFEYSKRGIIQGLKDESGIYIYGAGIVGKRWYRILKEHGIDNILGFIVTDKAAMSARTELLSENRESDCLNVNATNTSIANANNTNDEVIPIYQADELDAQEKERLVIIAVGKKFLTEIKKNLKYLGCKNVIVADEYMREMLKS